MALTLGSHGGHLDGVGGERSEARDTVLQGHVGQVVCHAGVGSVVLLPGDPVPWGDPGGGMSLAAAMSWPWPFCSASCFFASLALGALGPREVAASGLGPQVDLCQDASVCWVGAAGRAQVVVAAT